MAEIQELFKRLKPFYGNRIEDLRKVYLMEDRDGRTDLENTLQILESNLLGKSMEIDEPILVPPPKEIIQGPFTLGQVVYGSKKLFPWGLRPEELPSHICITGATGRGKSNICFHLIKNLLRENIPWLLFDFKRSVRDLLSDPIPYEREIRIFTVGRNICPFRFNPLIPPAGIDPKTWIDRLVDLVTTVQYAGFGVATLLRRAIDHVYQSVGMYGAGPLLRQPTLKEALKYLQDYKPRGREINWMSSTLRALEALCFGEMGKILNSQDPMDLEKILGMNVVFELDSLSNASKSFFIESILHFFHAYRLHQGGNETLKHVCIVEEAHRILKKSDHQSSTQDSILDIWVTEARQLGECLIILCQTPSILPAIALGNTYTTICLNLKHNSDINTMSKILLLPIDQKEALGKLPLGKAIVKLQGRWLSPFLIDIALYPIKKGSVNDENLKKRMEPHFTDSRSKEGQNKLPGKFQPSPGNGKLKRLNDNIMKDDFEEERMTEIEKNILMDIKNHPGSGVVERYKRLRMSRRKGNRAKQALMKKGHIRQIPIIIKKGKVVLLELTSTGKIILKRINGHDYDKKRTGGAVHEFWKEEIAKYYEGKGFRVIKEKAVNGGKTVDICVLNEGKRVAVEIETGRSDALWNIQKDIEAGFDEVVSVAVDEEVLARLRTAISKAYSDKKKVKVVCAKDFELC